MAEPVRLNIGGGNKRHEGWINVDIDPSADIQCDIRNIPLGDEVADEIMAIHVIEHFYHYEVQDVLWEWYRLLKPGGMLILECPDLRKACKAILEAVEAGNDIPQQMGMWPLYGDPRHINPYMCHKWLYTPSSLVVEVQKACFSDFRVQPAQFHMGEKRDLRVEAIR